MERTFLKTKAQEKRTKAVLPDSWLFLSNLPWNPQISWKIDRGKLLHVVGRSASVVEMLAPDSWNRRFLLCCCLAAMLTACTTTSETFDCKAGKGVGCKSISEVNQMVDEETVGTTLETRVPEKGTQAIPGVRFQEPGSRMDSHGTEMVLGSLEIPLSDHMAVHRAGEEHLRVWIAPFQDEHGNLHEGSIIHTVLNPGYWRVLRAQEPEIRAQESQ